MRVAIAGKGGTGKTTLSALLSRTLARSGRNVLAVDSDTNPNLASVLGFARPDADGAGAAGNGAPEPPPPLPRGLLERIEEPDGSRRLVLTRPLDEVLETYGAVGPDDVRLVVMEAVGHGGKG